MNQISFKHEEEGRRGRFLIFENDIPVGEMTYVWAGSNKFIIDHTETFEGFSGKGYGLKLVMEGVAFAREKGVKILPLCSFARKVFASTPEIQDVLFS